MTSTIKVNTVKDTASTDIIKKCGTSITVGTASDTTTVAGNAVRSNALQASDGQNIISQTGTTITLGASGDTIALSAGANQTGFGRTGTVDWQTTPKTATFTAVNGEGYFINTTAGVITINLPAGSAGAIVAISDYARTFGTNNLTISPNGSEKIGGFTEDAVLSTNGQAATFVYVDATEGWINVQETSSSITGAPEFVTACVSGSCNAIITSGDFKTAIFKSPGTFTVSAVAPGPSGNPNVGDYLVVAGGGGTSQSYGGGGGAGGFRMSNGHSLPAPETSPLANPTGIALGVQSYPITIGAGGAGGSTGANGGPSIFSTITSAGGGYSSGYPAPVAANPGGSGGAGRTIGNGNSPPTSPPQGNNGGSSPPGINAQGGGGGAGAAGGNGGPPSSTPGPGGIGSYISNTFVGPTAPSYGQTGPVTPTRYFAGGGAGGADARTGPPGAGIGGGGSANPSDPAAEIAGAVNMGGGGGGVPPGAKNGGSGIVMIRYKFQ